MQFLTRVFFESPSQLALLALGLLLVAYFAWLRVESASRRWIMPGTAAAIIVLFGVQALVHTQREELLDSLQDLIHAVERKDMPVLNAFFADDYRSDGMNHAGMMDYLQSAFKVLDVQDSRVQSADMTFGDRTAAMTLRVIATIRLQGYPSRPTGEWQIDWVRHGRDWQVRSLHPINIEGTPRRTLAEIRAW